MGRFGSSIGTRWGSACPSVTSGCSTTVPADPGGLPPGNGESCRWRGHRAVPAGLEAHRHHSVHRLAALPPRSQPGHGESVEGAHRHTPLLRDAPLRALITGSVSERLLLLGAPQVHVAPGLRPLEIEVSEFLDPKSGISDQRCDVAVQMTAAGPSLLHTVEPLLRAGDSLVGG